MTENRREGWVNSKPLKGEEANVAGGCRPWLVARIHKLKIWGQEWVRLSIAEGQQKLKSPGSM